VFTAERTWTSHDLIGFLKALPQGYRTTNSFLVNEF
jgi:hypothetical protein